MTRPSAPAVITAGILISGGAIFIYAGLTTRDWFWPAELLAGAALITGGLAALAAMWHAPDANPAHAPLPRKWTAADWAEVAEFERTDK